MQQGGWYLGPSKRSRRFLLTQIIQRLEFPGAACALVAPGGGSLCLRHVVSTHFQYPSDKSSSQPLLRALTSPGTLHSTVEDASRENSLFRSMELEHRARLRWRVDSMDGRDYGGWTIKGGEGLRGGFAAGVFLFEGWRETEWGS